MNRHEKRNRDDADRLMEWAEEQEINDTEATQPNDDEPCESDIVDDRVGLPGGTVGDLEDDDIEDTISEPQSEPNR